MQSVSIFHPQLRAPLALFGLLIAALGWSSWESYQVSQYWRSKAHNSRLSQLQINLEQTLRSQETAAQVLLTQPNPLLLAQYHVGEAELSALLAQAEQALAGEATLFSEVRRARARVRDTELAAFAQVEPGQAAADALYAEAKTEQDRWLRRLQQRLNNGGQPVYVAEAHTQLLLSATLWLSLLVLGVGVIQRLRQNVGLVSTTRKLSEQQEVFDASLSNHIRIERELRQSLTLQRAILDSANFTIIVTNLDGVVQIFNDAAERLLGYSASEMVGKQTPVILHDPEELSQRAAMLGRELDEPIQPGFEALVAKARLGMVDENEWQYVCKNGRRFPVQLSVTALCDEHYNVVGYLEIGTDISEAKKIEQMKAEFISTVSHELRTPLTSIRGSLGLLVGGALGEIPPQARPLLEIASKNCERLVRLINDILDIEKISAGKMQFDIKPHSLADIIEHSIAANRGYAEQFQTRLEFRNHAPEALAAVDYDRLQQVLTNLISNACKFSPPGDSVTVTLKRCHRGWLEVSVQDHGPGIAEPFRAQLFQKFVQADSSDTRSKGGTGLGLSISKAIIERFHGSIDFSSEEGRGARFYFQLPEFSPHPADPEQGFAAKPRRILVCESDPNVVKLLEQLLRSAGYATDSASTIEQARRLLLNRSYAAMTLEPSFAGGDGLGFLHELRADPGYARFPVVMVAARAERELQLVNGEALEFLDWVPKPLNPALLIQTLEHAVRAHKPADEPVRILHVEDDPDVREVVAAVLNQQAELSTAANLRQARVELRRQSFDLVLLDAGLPDGSGLNLLPELQQMRVPVVVFSAQQVPLEVAAQVKAAMVKTQTSNQALLDNILDALKPKP